MTDNTKRLQLNLLLTRPLAGSEAFWQALPGEVRSLVVPIFSPLIEIIPTESTPDIEGFVIFSSVNGVENSPLGNGRIAYCVGEMTTNAAVSAGWNASQVGETANQLVTVLAALPEKTVFTHLSGIHARGNIAQLLSAAGHYTRRIAVYDQLQCRFTSEATEAIASNFPLLVPLFSPRTALAFAEQDNGQAPRHLIALSEDVAVPVRKLNWSSLTVCAAPTRGTMIDAVQKVVTSITLG